MKTSTVVTLSILVSVILAVSILLAGFAGLRYLGEKMWERDWVMGEKLEGPDGYIYCIMYETSLGQDPGTRLIRTKNLKDEESYELLGSTNETSSWLPIIRPSDLPKQKSDLFYLTSRNILFKISYTDHISIVYDIDNHQFYEGYLNNEVSPFILLDEESELYEPDIFWVIFLVIDDDQRPYISNWPKITKDLRDGLTHPNPEVKKLSKWLLEIQEKGFSRDSDTINELVNYLLENADTNNLDSQEYIRKTLGDMGIDLPEGE